ncbi:MAG: preprotein translocase subunit SecE [Planctomycetota bacterium]|jgi:preprotein translocase SecE subunit
MKVVIYKPGQGKYTRVGTIIGVMLMVVVGAVVLSDKLGTWSSMLDTPAWKFGLPAGIAAALALLISWLVNRPKAADFLIATEGEMKKVSWSNRREVVGSTKVVIVTTFMLAGILFVVDLLLIFAFKRLDILPGASN